jgi:hypothetical protein
MYICICRDSDEVRAGRPGVQFPTGSRFWSSAQRPDRLWGPHSLLSSGYRELFPPAVKRPEREAGHTFISSAEIKNGGAIPPILLMA